MNNANILRGKTLQRVTIIGKLQGTTWYPPVEAEKDVSMRFSPGGQPFTHKWHGLREALLKVTNDGDFQSCMLAEAVMLVTWTVDNDVVRRHAEIPLCEDTRDLIVPL